MPVFGNEEHKQRLNLSSLACSVVEMDRGVMDEGGTLSGFLNRIIDRFWERADASIDVAVAERRRQLSQDGFSAEVLEKLLQNYRRVLLQKKEAYPQGQSLTFRLNNKNFQYLYEERAEEKNYSAPSKYLKALVEEYARLSPSERERVYYRELIETVLQPAMDAGYLLSVQMKERTFWVKPYSITADPFNSHLYLVGMSQPEGTGEWTIASFRISRLDKVRHRMRPSGRLTADDRREIEKKLQSTGVQYLIGNPEKITLRLTETGRREFLQRSYMRPLPEQVEGDVYTFSCTPMQIRNYFLSFGANVEILTPQSLRQDFICAYRQALESYQ